ncbi:winged helix-turn-helix transcriptional regulator [Rouxiella badensis]|jgi:DNA-binding HxlR family transcriptional regulator|uniref:Transcriptional regulator n=1 Tax=Rouxiella badensis TaxID=1646377 RepID=A0A1X0WI18_9GAMM|nr:helix-turn-helix domain-containing protein [Rouxiella badensis]MCC3703411.1 helix-turn-helix transcriptional regulator [Rouxiella badensis]MCC3718350.1 helix-turn-helix transcriptional regulator [Rouxiella badensis]MCC3726882.1 helix-turn-helix transcriptional regulator [Rouxiella badensis]MCC3731834.1 helix-turn-helix transcriptional regulator [Rouxiella badensis]MCC3738769.1 helix-turn-helix transcriptional regulator [Rouxiella badensis]
MKRTSFNDSVCPIARSLDLIGDWWTLLIVRDALGGIKRFSEFQRSLGAAKNILSSRLKTLVAEGILEIGPASDGSAYQEYVLTQKGKELYPILIALGQWGNQYLFAEDEACSRAVDRLNLQPIEPIRLHAKDGRVLGAEDIQVIPGNSGE